MDGAIPPPTRTPISLIWTREPVGAWGSPSASRDKYVGGCTTLARAYLRRRRRLKSTAAGKWEKAKKVEKKSPPATA